MATTQDSSQFGGGKDGGGKDGGGSKAKGLLGSVQPLVNLVKSVDPKATKTSAARGAAGAKDLLQLSVGYVKQETTEPVRTIARYLAMGLAAAVLFSTGSILLVLSVLRAVQGAWAFERPDDRGPLSGSWSWAPYAVTVVACAVVIGLVALLFKRGSRKLTRSGGAS